MAPSIEEQQFWVARLLKRIQKSGYKATGQVLGFTYPLQLMYIVQLVKELSLCRKSKFSIS